MWHQLQSLASQAVHTAGHLDRQQWICVFAAALVAGVFLLRGFGSRTNY